MRLEPPLVCDELLLHEEIVLDSLKLQQPKLALCRRVTIESRAATSRPFSSPSKSIRSVVAAMRTRVKKLLGN
ncbi:hypothetical protein DVH24_030008 [Malus domestica]|uniref:Uncharacterized protein n=1 Tax=Malus domestica TaxID=3750 RepID=A0A498I090_MALDO|nr:hypothetical protein DVH24_030008 [Malus domestica]